MISVNTAVVIHTPRCIGHHAIAWQELQTSMFTAVAQTMQCGGMVASKSTSKELESMFSFCNTPGCSASSLLITSACKS